MSEEAGLAYEACLFHRAEQHYVVAPAKLSHRWHAMERRAYDAMSHIDRADGSCFCSEVVYGAARC